MALPVLDASDQRILQQFHFGLMLFEQPQPGTHNLADRCESSGIELGIDKVGKMFTKGNRRVFIPTTAFRAE